MQQPIINDKTEDRGVSDRLESIEDELQLVKAAVKQTLIDLREFMMKGSAMSVTSTFVKPAESSSNGQVIASERQANPPAADLPTEPENTQAEVPEVQGTLQSQESAVRPQIANEPKHIGPAPQSTPVTPPIPFPQFAPAPVLPGIEANAQAGLSMDAIKMGNILRWLGTVARKGLSASHLEPYLQAYEKSGLLTREMAALTYRSLEHMEYAMGRTHQSYSTTEYSDCVLELHEIICNPGYKPKNDSYLGRNPNG